MRRACAAAVAAIAAVLVVSVASARPRATVTLRMAMPTTVQLAQDVLIKNFERVYPNIAIDVQYLPSDQLSALETTQLQAGNAPDLFWVFPGRGGINGVWPLAEQGRLLDLTGRPWQRRIYSATKDEVMSKGKVYAWPLVVSPNGIIVNTDLFRQLGLKAPARFADVLALCRKITAAGKVPIAEAFGNVAAGSLVGRQLYGQFVYNLDPQWDAKRLAKKTTFAGSPLWHRALQALVDMKDAGCFQPGAQGTSRPQQYALFARGDAVMMLGTVNELPNVLAINPAVKYAVMNLPADSAKNTVDFVATSIAIAANAATQYPKEARTYIDFVAREQQSSLFARAAGAVAPLDAKKGILPPTMSAMAPLFKAGKVVSGRDADWPNPAVFQQGLAPGIIGLMTGQSTVDSVLQNMDRLWDAPS